MRLFIDFGTLVAAAGTEQSYYREMLRGSRLVAALNLLRSAGFALVVLSDQPGQRWPEVTGWLSSHELVVDVLELKPLEAGINGAKWKAYQVAKAAQSAQSHICWFVSEDNEACAAVARYAPDRVKFFITIEEASAALPPGLLNQQQSQAG